MTQPTPNEWTYSELVESALTSVEAAADILEFVAQTEGQTTDAEKANYLKTAEVALAGGQIFATLAVASATKNDTDVFLERYPAKQPKLRTV